VVPAVVAVVVGGMNENGDDVAGNNCKLGPNGGGGYNK
jgi:hypothetical protein